MSKKHEMEIFQKQDDPHLKAMSKIQALMKNPGEMEKWFKTKQKEFEDLPEK